MTAEEIRKLFPDPEFGEAVEILEMIKQTPEKMHEYSARMKLRLDESARLEYAREEGIEKGKLLGEIKLLQKFLGIETPTSNELSRYELPKLTALSRRLKKKLPDRLQ